MLYGTLPKKERLSYFEADAKEVVGLLMDANLTKNQYSLIRRYVNSKLPHNLLASYDNVLHAKKFSHPSNVKVMESDAQAKL